MTDKVQLIKQEIERQIEEGKVKCQQSQENNDHESFVAWSEHIATCGKILLFIDSIPENNNLIWHKSNESPIKGKLCLYETNQKIVDLIHSNGKEMPDWCNNLDDLLKIDSHPEEPASEDLEEEIDKIWKTCNPIDEGMGVETANIHIEQFDDIAKHFVEWQKQQMIKNAVDGCVSPIVKEDVSSHNLFISTPQLYKELQKYKDGDKLKIIIVKEEQQ